jgi:hypothetical protein
MDLVVSHISNAPNVALFLPFADYKHQQRGANTDTAGTRDSIGMH